MTHIESVITQTPPPRSAKSGVLLTFTDPVGYSVAWSLQEQLHADRVSGDRPDTLMLLQHLPVYTTGRRTKSAHLKPELNASSAFEVPIVPVNRGGSVTYHGPGQLVGYPILALSRYAYGAKAYVYMLEEVLMHTLGAWDIRGHRMANAPGIGVRHQWGEAKIASIGARIDRGVTLHGFALNVSTDLSPFSRIVPCGLEGCRMTSMEALRCMPLSVHVVAEELARIFSTVFQVDWAQPARESIMRRVMEAQAVGRACKHG